MIKRKAVHLHQCGINLGGTMKHIVSILFLLNSTPLICSSSSSRAESSSSQRAGEQRRADSMALRSFIIQGHTNMADFAIYLFAKDYTTYREQETEMTFLHYAALHQRLRIAQKLVDYGIDLHEIDSKGRTALDYACMSSEEKNIDQTSSDSSVAVCKALLDAGAKANGLDLNGVDQSKRARLDGKTPLYHAIRNRENGLELCKLLIDNGAKPDDQCDGSGHTSLTLAAELGLIEICKYLLERGALINGTHRQLGVSALHIAVKHRNAGLCKLLLDSNEKLLPGRKADLVMARDNEGKIPFHYVLSLPSDESIEKLLFGEKTETKIDQLLYTIPSTGDTLLHVACSEGNFDAVKRLIEAYGANVNAEAFDGETALYRAIKQLHGTSKPRNLQICKFLIEHGALQIFTKVSTKNKRKRSPLHFAVSLDLVEIVALLLTHKVEVNQPDAEGLTPLHIACQTGSKEMCDLLVSSGGNFFAKDLKWYEPFHYACERKADTLAVHLLTRYKDKIPLATRGVPYSPLHAACRRGHTALASKLIKECNIPADLRAASTKEYAAKTPLHFAAEAGHTSTCDSLVEAHGAQLDAKTVRGQTPLALACINAREETALLLMEKLIRHLPDGIHSKDDEGNTVLHQSALRGNITLCGRLIARGAGIDVQNGKGETPLHLAARAGSFGVCELLLNKGARSSIQDEKGNIPLHYACECRITTTALLDLFLAASPLSRATFNADGFIPLHCAVKSGNLEICRYLVLGNPSEIVCRTQVSKKTLLHIAVEGQNENMVNFCVEKKVDLDAQNAQGNTALHLAAYLGNQKLYSALLQAGANKELINSDRKRADELFNAASRAERENEKNTIYVKTKGELLGDHIGKQQYSTSALNPSQATITRYLARPINQEQTDKDSRLNVPSRTQGSLSRMRLGNLPNEALHQKLPMAPRSNNDDDPVLLPQGQVPTAPRSNDDDDGDAVPTKLGTVYSIVPAPRLTQSEINLFESISGDSKGDFMVALLNYKKGGSNVNASWMSGRTALLLVVEKGNCSYAEFLIDAGANIEQEDEDGIWPLALAARKGDIAMCSLLLRAGANIHRKSSEGKSIIHFACLSQNEKLLDLLATSSGPELFTIPDNAGTTPLHEASSLDAPSLCSYLLAHGASVSPRDVQGRTPLHRAVIKDSPQVAKVLLESGADPFATDDQGNSSWALLIKKGAPKSFAEFEKALRNRPEYQKILTESFFNAISLGHRNLCAMFLALPADLIKASNGKGMSPLHVACLEGHFDLVATLLIKNPGSNSLFDHYGRLPIHCACLSNDMRSVTAIIESNRALLNAPTAGGDLPLHVACQAGKTEICRGLLALDSKLLNARNKQGATALQLACLYGKGEVIDLLLQQGVVSSVVDGDGSSVLHYACQSHNLDMISRRPGLFSPLIMLPNYEGILPLHSACEFGNTGAASWILSRSEQKNVDDQLTAVTRNRNSALQLAAEGGFTETCEVLLKKGAPVDFAEDEQALSPLHNACQQKNLSLAQLFLSYKAQVDKKTANGNTALHLASSSEDTSLTKDSLVHLLVSTHKASFLKNSSGEMPLHRACLQGALETAKKLVELGHPLECTDNAGETPLMIAVDRGNLSLVQFLVEKGASLETLKERDDTLLHRACRKGHEAIVRFLLTHKESASLTEMVGGDNLTALFEAIIWGHVNICRLLCSHKAPIHPEGSKNSGIHLALGTKNNSKEILKCLLEFSSPEVINAYDEEGLTPLHRAVEEGDVSACEMLLEAKALVNKTDNGTNKNSPLHVATFQNFDRLCKLLLSKGADPNLKNAREETPLMTAVSRGYAEVAFLLLEKGAHVDDQDSGGLTPLHMALGTEDEIMCRILLAQRANCNIAAGEKRKLRPLHVACSQHNIELVDLVLKNIGEGIDVQDGFGRTGLHFACEQGNIEIIRLLLQNGASLLKKDNKEKTPLEYVIQYGRLDILQLLLTLQPGFDVGYILHRAAYYGHQEICDYFLTQNKNLVRELDSKTGFSLLCTAIQGGARELNKKLNEARPEVIRRCESVCKLLIEGHGADIDYLCNNSCRETNFEKCVHEHVSAVHLACSLGLSTIVKYLLSQRPDLENRTNCFGETPLHSAVRAGKDQVISLVLLSPQRRVNVAALNCRGENALMYTGNLARLRGDKQDRAEKIARTLLIIPQPFDKGSNEGMTPLHYAFQGGCMGLVKLLLVKGADINKCDNAGNSMLYYAVKAGFADGVALCRKHGLDPLKKNDAGVSPLDYVTDLQDKPMIKCLTEPLESEVAELPVRNQPGVTLGRQASLPTNRVGHQQIPSRPSSGASAANSVNRAAPSINDAGNYGASRATNPIADSSRQMTEKKSAVDDDFMFNLLLDIVSRGNERELENHLRGQDSVKVINRRNGFGMAPLHLAAKLGHVGCAKLLMHFGVDRNSVNSEGMTALHLAAADFRKELVQLLAIDGMVDAVNNNGCTALHIVLLAAGSIGIDGDTISSAQMFSDALQCVKILLRSRANVNIQDLNGDSPIHIAASQKYDELLNELLEAKGANVNLKNKKGHTPLNCAETSDFADNVIRLLDANPENTGSHPREYWEETRAERYNKAVQNRQDRRKPIPAKSSSRNDDDDDIDDKVQPSRQVRVKTTPAKSSSSNDDDDDIDDKVRRK